MTSGEIHKKLHQKEWAWDQGMFHALNLFPINSMLELSQPAPHYMEAIHVSHARSVYHHSHIWPLCGGGCVQESVDGWWFLVSTQGYTLQEWPTAEEMPSAGHQCDFLPPLANVLNRCSYLNCRRHFPDTLYLTTSLTCNSRTSMTFRWCLSSYNDIMSPPLAVFRY